MKGRGRFSAVSRRPLAGRTREAIGEPRTRAGSAANSHELYRPPRRQFGTPRRKKHRLHLIPKTPHQVLGGRRGRRGLLGRLHSLDTARTYILGSSPHTEPQHPDPRTAQEPVVRSKHTKYTGSARKGREQSGPITCATAPPGHLGHTVCLLCRFSGLH